MAKKKLQEVIAPPKNVLTDALANPPTPDKTQPPIKDENPKFKTGVFTDERTGALSGITLPNGKVVLGLTPKEVNNYMASLQAKTAIPVGAESVAQQQQQQAQQQQQQELVQQAATQVGELTPEQKQLDVIKNNPLELVGVAGSALTGGASGLGAAGIGAKGLGALGVTTGVGAGVTAGLIAGGALLGAVGGYSFIERQNAKKAKEIYSNSITNMNKIVSGINTGTIPPELYSQAVQAYNLEKANLLSAQRNINEQTDGDLKKFLSGADGLAFEVNNYVDNVLPFLDTKLISAIYTPNPANIVQA